MNKIEKLILRGAGFSILFMLLYFVIGTVAISAMGLEASLLGDINIGKFFLILLFGYTLAMANFVFEGRKIRLWIKRLCVYLISALAFFFIFVLGTPVGDGAAKIFVALVVFTVIYVISLLVACLIKRTVIEGKAKKRPTAKNEVEKKSEYKSRFGD